MNRLRVSAAALAMACLFAALPSRAQSIDYAGQFVWLDRGQQACLDQAVKAIDAAGGQFGLPFKAQTSDGFQAAGNLGHTTARIFCVADGKGGVVDPAARRTLVVIDVNTIRPQLSASLRDFLLECVRDDRCASSFDIRSLNGYWGSSSGRFYLVRDGVWNRYGKPHLQIRCGGTGKTGGYTGTRCNGDWFNSDGTSGGQVRGVIRIRPSDSQLRFEAESNYNSSPARWYSWTFAHLTPAQVEQHGLAKGTSEAR